MFEEEGVGDQEVPAFVSYTVLRRLRHDLDLESLVRQAPLRDKGNRPFFHHPEEILDLGG